VSGLAGVLLVAVLVIGAAAGLAPSAARRLLRWGARRIGHDGQARRYEEEWLADLERVPGKTAKLAHACGVVALSVPRLRAQFRCDSRRALLPGWIAGGTSRRPAGAPELDAALQRVAEILVPHFADHCFVDLFQGNVLIRRAARHAGGWTPPPGAWARVGEQIRFPDGHFCQRAMASMDIVVVSDTAATEDSHPAPSAKSLDVAHQVGVTSVIAAPLCARGKLLGVMAIATSGLTGRNQRFDAGDRQFMGAVASRVSAAVDAAGTVETRPAAQLWAGAAARA
jgi:GAF domain-containing protein